MPEKPISPKAGGSIKAIIYSRLVRAIATGAGISLVAQGAVFLMHMLLGRELGPAGYGIFSLVLGLAMLVAQLSPLGWQIIITRLIPQYSTEGAWGLLRGAVLRSNQITVINSIIASILIYTVSRWLVLERDVLLGVNLATMLLPLLAVKILLRRQLMGLDTPKLGIFLDDAVAPLLMIAVALSLGFNDPKNVVIVYMAVVLLVCLWGAFAVHNRMPERSRGVNKEFQTKAWMVIAFPATLALASRIALNRIDILMIGPMIGVYEVGLYSTAQRISYVLLFMPMVIGTITSSMIAGAWYKNDMGEVRKIFIVSTVISTSVAALIMLVLLPFSDLAVRFSYGDQFMDAVGILQILLIGQFFQAAGGAISPVMMMTGQEKTFSFTITVIMLVNVIGNFIAIPIYGAIGAAIVTASCIIILNIWQFYLLNKRLLIFSPGAKPTP